MGKQTEIDVMDFGSSKKMLAFCLFSCAVHVLFFALSSQPAGVSVSTPSIGVSFVDVSIPDFKPTFDSWQKAKPPISAESLDTPKAPEPQVINNGVAPPPVQKKQPVMDTAEPIAVAEPPKAEEVAEETPIKVSTATMAAPEPEIIVHAGGAAPEQGSDIVEEKRQVPEAIPLPDMHAAAELFKEPRASSGAAEPSAAPSQGVGEKTDLAAGTSAQKGLELALPLYDVNPKPKYPKVARSRGWEGSVLLEVSVAADGRVEKISLLQTSGYRVLDKAARRTVYRWKFKPASIGGVPTACTVQIPINFQLNTSRG